MENEAVDDFLLKLGKLDIAYYYCQRENVDLSRRLENGHFDRTVFLNTLEPAFKKYESKGAGLEGLDVYDAKNLSHDDLKKMTNNFSEENFIKKVGLGRLFRGVMPNGEGMREVTVKTWDFILFESRGISYEQYPRCLRDEIVLLARSEMKTHPFLVKLVGFCFEKKLAVVYDLKFNTLLRDMLESAEFGWEERMKVATNIALLHKTFSKIPFDVRFDPSDVMIDKEYNITLMDFEIWTFPQTLAIYNAGTPSDPFRKEPYEKMVVLELGDLLFELVTKRQRSWKEPCTTYIARLNGRSAVAESFEIAGDTGTKITNFILSWLRENHEERPDIDSVFEDLVLISGYRPALSDSPPWLINPRKRSHSAVSDSDDGHDAWNGKYCTTTVS